MAVFSRRNGLPTQESLGIVRPMATRQRMTAAELERRASRLFGDHWQAALRDYFGVTHRTARNWAAGRIPPWLDRALSDAETLARVTHKKLPMAA